MTSRPDLLPPTTSVGAVQLRVADLDRSLGFYRDILGYQVDQLGEGRVRLRPADGGRHHCELRVVPGAGQSPVRAAGLYHAAILLPSRRDLARVVAYLHGQGVPFGQSDHGVSEALYLNDPDGNGLEIYADRPRDQWPRSEEGVAMVVDPIDFEDLLGELEGDDDLWSGMPSSTTIGHVHLRVSDIDAARDFYVDTLGFEVMQSSLPGALFISAGGYHHHLGLNVWESRGHSLAPEDAAGLDSFSVVLPDRASLDELTARLDANGLTVRHDDGGPEVHDPDGIRVRLEVDA